MDINYLLAREQCSLYNASVAANGPARLAHEGMASAYRRLLIEAGFPHWSVAIASVGSVEQGEADRWLDDGGPDATSTPTFAKDSSACGEPGSMEQVLRSHLMPNGI